MDSITNHGVELPDPAVCFDDEGYEPSNNDIPKTYEVLSRAIRELDINSFSLGINSLYSSVKPTVTVQNQLKSALVGFTLRQQSNNISYDGPKQFKELGYYDTIIDTDLLLTCLEKDIVELKSLEPIRNTRMQDRMLTIPLSHKAFDILNDIKDRRDVEVDEALNGKNSRDVSEANVNQVDIGIAKGLAQQHNFIASSLNKNRYGSGSQQNIQINIGDLHLDALRKMKVIDHE